MPARSSRIRFTRFLEGLLCFGMWSSHVMKHLPNCRIRVHSRENRASVIPRNSAASPGVPVATTDAIAGSGHSSEGEHRFRTVTPELPLLPMAFAILSAERMGTVMSEPPCRIRTGQCTRPAYISGSMVRKTRSESLRSCGRDLVESITVNVWTQLDSVTEMVP